jgi:hypothetical protein
MKAVTLINTKAITISVWLTPPNKNAMLWSGIAANSNNRMKLKLPSSLPIE